MKLLSPSENFQEPIDVKFRTIDTAKFFNKDNDDNIKLLLKIEKKTIKIDKFLKKSLKNKTRSNEKTRVKTEKESFTNREKELENKKPKMNMSGIKLPAIKSFGVFDWIKNFISNVILGFIAVRLIKFLPDLIKFLPIISKVMDFFIDVGGKLLDGLVTFIDWGYKSYDATRGFIKNIFGDKDAKVFDDLSSKFATFMNIAVIAGLMAAGSGGGFGGRGARGGAGTKPRFGQRFGSKVTESGGGRVGGLGIRNPFRQKPNITESGQFRNPLRRGPRVTGDTGRASFQNPFKARPNITGAVGEGVEGVASRGVTKFGARLGSIGSKGIPIIGPLLDFGIRTLIFHEPLGRAAAGAVGTAIGQILGAIIGSVIPVGGTIIGEIAGGFIGSMIGTSLYDFVTQFSGPKNMAGGGVSTSATTRQQNVSGPSTRTIKKRKSKRTITPRPKKINPGSSTGGKDKIMGLFPDTEEAENSTNPVASTVGFIGSIINNLFGGNSDATKKQTKEGKKKPNPYQYLTKSAEILGKADFFGPLFVIPLKTNLGDEPNNTDYLLAAKGLNSWFNSILNFNTLALAGGGQVNVENLGMGEDYTNIIADSIKDSAIPQIDKSKKELMRNLMLQKVEPTTTPNSETNAETNVGADGGSEFSEGGITGTGINKGISIAKKLMVDLKISPAAAAGIVGNLLHESGGLKPDNVEDGKGFQDGAINNIPVGTQRVGYGWAQWTNDRLENFRKFLRARKADNRPATDADNYAYLIHELTTTEPIKGHWKGWGGKNIPEDDPKRAATWFMMNWERPGAPHEDSRHDYAVQVFSKIKGLSREQARAEVEKSGGKIYSGEGTTSGMIGGSGKFIQGNSGRSKGVHFHIGPGSQTKGTILQPQYNADARATAAKVVDFFLKKGSSVYDGRRGVYYKSGKEVGAAQRAHTASGSQGGIDLQVDYERPVPFPLNVTGMAYRRNGFGVSADILGSNSFVAHGRYDEKGRKAPQELMSLYETGGETLDGPHHAIIGEKGKEYVIDADSYKATEKLLPGLLDVLNYDVHDRTSLRKNIPSMISSLQQYASYEEGSVHEIIVVDDAPYTEQTSYELSAPSVYSSHIDTTSDQFQILNMV